MKIIEYMKNIFAKKTELPAWFERNPDFDAVLLSESFGSIPELVHAKDGFTYVYFDGVDAKLIDMVRKMGFNPRLHKSHKYTPAKNIYRARLNNDVPFVTMDVVDRLTTLGLQDIERYKSNVDYLQYVADYKFASNQK